MTSTLVLAGFLILACVYIFVLNRRYYMLTKERHSAPDVSAEVPEAREDDSEPVRRFR
jgi:hypothetical protein